MHRFQDKIKDPYEVTHYSGDLAQLKDVPSFTVVTLLNPEISSRPDFLDTMFRNMLINYHVSTLIICIHFVNQNLILERES